MRVLDAVGIFSIITTLRTTDIHSSQVRIHPELTRKKRDTLGTQHVRRHDQEFRHIAVDIVLSRDLSSIRQQFKMWSLKFITARASFLQTKYLGQTSTFSIAL